MAEYTKATVVNLRERADLNEAWIRDRIVDDPTILGLGDLEVKAIERILPKAGRLDLLLVDPETDKRYEVELMLGATDASHIIRCLEYWDIERKRYPQYDHCAVLVAEDITSRFLNVISLFNGFIPVIAVKMTALEIGDRLVLHFVKVMDEMTLGDDEDGETLVTTDRKYWEEKGSRESLAIADDCLKVLREVVPSVALKYNRHYIGLSIDGIARNFAIMRPKREFLRVSAKVGKPETWADKLEEAGIVVMEGGRTRGRIVFRLGAQDLKDHHQLLHDLFATAYGLTEE